MKEFPERNYREIEPEVAGGLGEHSVLDYSTSPPTVIKLHYEFSGWLGDELLTTTPCFLVTIPLKNALQQFSGSGYTFDDVTVTKSILFEQRFPELVLPEFAWLRVFGEPGVDDIGLGRRGSLVVSPEILAKLELHEIKNCVIRKRPFRRITS